MPICSACRTSQRFSRFYLDRRRNQIRTRCKACLKQQARDKYHGDAAYRVTKLEKQRGKRDAS